MASTQPSFNELRQQISKGRLAPVYMLYGEEGYYIDRLIEDFEALVPPEERDFNLYTFYGAETTPAQVIEACSRYPMMADRVVVILREGQAMRADAFNKIHTYVNKPNASTLLLIVCRGEKAKGKDLVAAVKKNGVLWESKKLSEKTVMPVISDLIKSKGLNIEPKGLNMLREFIGTDVSRLYNEIDKLAMVLGKGAMVTPEAIERNIGISKDYNNFELVDALAVRDAAKAYRIIDYFKANPKNNPTVVTASTLFNFFSSLIILQFMSNKPASEQMAAIGARSSWQMKRYEPALRHYNAWQTMEIISAIRRFDANSKGIGSRQDSYNLLRDLVFHILTAPGKISV